MTSAGPHQEVLDQAAWLRLEAAHQEAADELTADHLARSSRHAAHPVHDFLFSYYQYRPAQLRRWHPGAAICLLDAPDRATWRFHCLDQSAGRSVTVVDTAQFLAARGPSVQFIRDLLRRSQVAPAQFGCFGLHEWAMVYRTPDRRHLQWPLRLGAEATDQVVDAHQLRCSHYDAVRFFTPAARPRNLLAPELASRHRSEQPGCLHASMDLYKWAYRLTPVISSALVLACFRLARAIREVDMRASPYDLSELGYRPIAVENTAGKAEYVAFQRDFADRAQVLRSRLLSELSWVPEGIAVG